MKKPNQIAIREAAKDAAQHLAAWTAIEAMAKENLKAVEKNEASGNFAEVHFKNGNFVGIIKAGDVVLKIEG